MLQDRLNSVIGRLRAGHHHCERAVHRALDAAADRRIDQGQVPRFESLRNQFCSAGPGGGQVDQDRGAVSGNNSIGPQRNRLDDVRCRQTAQHDIGARCHFGRRFRKPGAARNQRCGRLRLQIVNAQRIAGVEQASGHRSTHAARSDKADCFCCHGSLPVAPQARALSCSCRARVPRSRFAEFQDCQSICQA